MFETEQTINTYRDAQENCHAYNIYRPTVNTR